MIVRFTTFSVDMFFLEITKTKRTVSEIMDAWCNWSKTLFEMTFHEMVASSLIKEKLDA